MRKILISATLVMVCLFGQAQNSKNMTLLDSLTFQTTLSDVWAFEYDSTEYALVGLYNGVAIVSLANPANPTVLQTIPGQGSIWRDMHIYDHYAYASNESGGGLLIIDFSNLPGTVSYKDTIIAGLNTAHNVFVDGDFLYMFGADIDNGGASIFDVGTDPWNPSKVGSWSTRYIHDGTVRDDTLWAGAVYDGLVEMINCSNKSNPTLMGNKTYVNAFTHNVWPNDKGDICWSTDELANAYIYAWDVSNPANITELGKIRSDISNGTATPHNAHWIDDFLVVSYYKDGIVVFDVARPHNMIQTGWYDTNPITGGGTDGCWGAYPYLKSGICLATDVDEGFFVFDPTYTRGCYLEGDVTDSVTGNPINGATVTINMTNASDDSDPNGFYATGVADAGTYTATYSKFGYKSKTVSVTLNNGVLTTKNVELVAAPTLTYTIHVEEEGTGNAVPGASVIASQSGGSIDYTADQNGDIVAQNFFEGSWDFLAGAWGYQTKQITDTADQNNTNIVIKLDPGYYDDFMFDFNWTVSGTANAGIWEKGDPVGTSMQGLANPEDDDPNDFGLEAYVTGNAGGNAGNDDVDGGETILTSPVMDLSLYTMPTLKFKRWFANGGGFGGSIDDTLTCQITNDGVNWKNLTQVFGGANNQWTQEIFPISLYVTPNTTVQVRFICGDYGNGHVVEGAIDVFEVTGAPVFVSRDVDMTATSLQVFPNPMGEETRISYDLAGFTGDVEFVLTDLAGRTIQTRTISDRKGSFKLKFEGPSGVYLGSLKAKDGTTIESVRIVK